MGGCIQVPFRTHSNINSDEEGQSLARYFSQSNIYEAEISYRILLQRPGKTAILLGFQYASGFANGQHDDFYLLLGKKLNITSFTPFVGFGLCRPDTNFINAFLYGTVGMSFKSYEGSYTYTVFETKQQYKAAQFVKFTLGLDLESVAGLPFLIKSAVSFEMGTIRRSNILFYENKQLVGHLHATGDLTLPDHSISFLVAVGYIIDF